MSKPEPDAPESAGSAVARSRTPGPITIALAVAGTVAVCALVATRAMPLGVSGEWTWDSYSGPMSAERVE